MKKRILRILTLLVAIITPNLFGYSQDVVVKGNIDRDSVLTGHTFNYDLNIRVPNGYIINWNEIGDTLSKSIDVISRSEISEQPIDNSSDILLSQTLSLASFDTGYVEIPKIGIKYYKSAKDTTSYMGYTDMMDIYVKPATIDTTMAYKPIIMPVKQNITFEETIPYFGGAIVLAGLILLIIYLVKKSRNKENNHEEEVKPQIPAIITAREKLALLKDANLWQSGRYKDYYTDLTDIAREYLEGEFIYEPGFSSTSLLRSNSFFSNKPEWGEKCNIEIEYYIPKNCQEGAVLLSDILSYSKAQLEYVINSGSLTKILSVELNTKRTKAYIKAILLPKIYWNKEELEQEYK